MSGILLDSHALYWLVSGDVVLLGNALDLIGENQDAGTLFVSPITAWEIAIAAGKRHLARRPHLGADSPERWFREAVRATSARIVPIHQRVALAAARVVMETGHKDPGDCFLIASARVRRMPIVTRDQLMHSLAAEWPGYLNVIAC